MSPLPGIARLVRQICLLRERGETAAASRLEENEFATAVRDLRLTEGLEAITDGELQAMFDREEKRVADAVVLAELLIPQLAGSFPVVAQSVRCFEPSHAVGRVDPAPASRTAEASGSTPAIPDLLDAMLAADSAARRQRNNRFAT